MVGLLELCLRGHGNFRGRAMGRAYDNLSPKKIFITPAFTFFPFVNSFSSPSPFCLFINRNMPSISPCLVPNLGSPPTSPLPSAGRPRSRSNTLSRATSFSSTSSRRSQPEIPPLPPNLPPTERSRSRSSTLSHATSFSSTSSRHPQVPPSPPGLPPDGRPRSRSSTLSRATSSSSISSRHSHVPPSPYNRDKALPVPPLTSRLSPSKDASTSYHSYQHSSTTPARPTPDLPRLSTSPETRVLPQGHTGVVPRSHGPSNTVKNVRRKRTIGDGADVRLLGPEVVQVPDTTHASVKTLLHEVQLYISLLYCAIEERSPRSQILQTAKTAVQWNTRLFEAMDPVARNSNDPRAFYELQHAAEMALSHLISYILAASSLNDDLWTIAPDLLDMVVRAVVLSVRLISPDNPSSVPLPSSAHAPASETPHRRASRDRPSRKFSTSSRLSSSSETSLSSIDSEPSPTAPTPTADEKDAQWVYYGFSNIPRKPLAPNHPLLPPKVCLDYSIMKVIGRGYDPDSRAPYVVRSGTLRALVYVLTENPDSQLRDELQEIFFTCFRLWGVHAVFDALMAQYPPRARAHGLDSEVWNKHAIAHQATQHRVMSLLTTWVHCHWRFEDWVALDALYEFATTQTLRISAATAAAEDLVESLDALRQTTQDQRTGPRSNDSDRRMKPKWLDPHYYSAPQAKYMDALVRDLANDHASGGSPGRYTLDISRFGGKKWWIALASQITLVSHDLIRAFRAEDIISHDQHGGRKCKDCPTSRQLAELRTFHEGLVFWVQRNVLGLGLGSTEERMDGLRNFIELAEVRLSFLLS